MILSLTRCADPSGAVTDPGQSLSLAFRHRRPVTVDTLASAVAAALVFHDVSGIHDFKGMDALESRLEKRNTKGGR